MKRYLLPEGGNFYKANMHMHTNISDGKMTPEETKKAYMDLGYSIVAFTDHEVLVPQNNLSDENFLAITSYEVAVNEKSASPFPYKKTYHLNLYAKDKNATVSSVFSERHVWLAQSKQYIAEEAKQHDYKRAYSVEAINDLIAKANADGFLVCYNHPVWSLQNYSDYSGLKGLWGIEVYNTASALGGSVDTVQPYVDLLREGVRLCPVAADDAHAISHCGGGWITVKAENLEYSTVMEALERGDLYATTGPEISELYLEDNILHISCSEAVEVRMRTERRLTGCRRGTAEAPLTAATFDLTKYFELCNAPEAKWDHWFRVEVLDKTGKIAYTRAYFLDELSSDD